MPQKKRLKQRLPTAKVSGLWNILTHSPIVLIIPMWGKWDSERFSMKYHAHIETIGYWWNAGFIRVAEVTTKHRCPIPVVLLQKSAMVARIENLLPSRGQYQSLLRRTHRGACKVSLVDDRPIFIHHGHLVYLAKTQERNRKHGSIHAEGDRVINCQQINLENTVQSCECSAYTVGGNTE